MTTKYVLFALFILILIPSSLSGVPPKGLTSIGKGKVASSVAKFLKRISGAPDPNDEKQDGISTYNYSVSYSYIDMAFYGPYVNAEWDFTGGIIWANCDRQANPIYDRSKSSNFSFVPCSDPLCPQSQDPHYWNFTCPKECSLPISSGQDSTNVSLARDNNFTLGNLVLAGPDIVFLCGTDNGGVYDNITGIIGLGWGDLSLVSQLGYGKFSYCLNSNLSDKSPLFLLDSQPIPSGNLVNSIPLIQSNQSNQSSAYYVNLKEILVGTELLPIPNTTFSLQEDGTGGVLLDSSSFYSFLETEGYEQVKDAILSYVSLPQVNDSDIGLDVCFSISDIQLSSMPTITLQFDGGADIVLDPYYYLVTDDTKSLVCLAILPSNQSYYDDKSLSVLGYLLQSNKHMFFHLNNSMLYYMPANCSTSMIQHYSRTSSSNLILPTGVGIYFQILFAFMFQVLVAFVF